MKMPSNMKNIFAQNPQVHINRSTFDRSSTYKSTFTLGNGSVLWPVFIDNVLPGDTYEMRANTFARLATPIAPCMDNIFIDYHTFFVPCRLLMDNWERFMGAQDNPGDSINYVVPTIDSTTAPAAGYVTQSIYDYMGIPTNVDGTKFRFSALPFRGYNLIWNTWYRDQNLQNSVSVPTSALTDNYTNYVLLPRNKRHDYFTSALPQAQKFSANGVNFLAPSYNVLRASNAPAVKILTAGTNSAPTDGALSSSAGDLSRSGVGSQSIDPNGGLYVNFQLDTINTLRQAFQLQQFLETDNRGGTRYIELLRAHFGVINPDYRLQRPEFIHGSSSPLNFNPVTQTAPPTTAAAGATPQGNLAAFGTHSATINYKKSFTEHGYLYTLASLRADLTYQNGLDRHWSYTTRYDFPWPEFAKLGENVILNKELQTTNVFATNDLAWGWQERYGEARFKNSKITGAMKSTPFLSAGYTTLDWWHLGQNLTGSVSLSDAFIREKPPLDRILAVTTNTQIIFDSFWNLKCTRALPVHGIPQSLLRL